MTAPLDRATRLSTVGPRPWSRRAAAVVIAAAVVATGLGGCSSSGGDSAGETDTIATGSPTASAADAASCESVEPGVVVDRALAVVFFDTQSVCPGWVTVEQGTQVTFTNRDSAPHTVVVTASQLPDSAEIARFEIPAGGSQPLDTRDVARLGFSTDALPGFRGTVEVVASGGGVQH